MSQLMVFVGDLSWFGDSGPMPRLSTDQAFVSCLVLQGLGVCHRASQEGGQHLGMPCLFLSLLLLFSVMKGIGGCLDHLI